MQKLENSIETRLQIKLGQLLFENEALRFQLEEAYEKISELQKEETSP